MSLQELVQKWPSHKHKGYSESERSRRLRQQAIEKSLAPDHGTLYTGTVTSFEPQRFGFVHFQGHPLFFHHSQAPFVVCPGQHVQFRIEKDPHDSRKWIAVHLSKQ